MLKHLALAALLAIPSTADAWSVLNVPRSQSIGNSQWGAGFTATSKTSYTSEGVAGTTGDRLKADQSLAVWTRMFGEKDTIVDLRGSGHNVIGGERAYHVGLYVNLLGNMVEVWGDDNAYENAIAMDDSLSRTFASAEARFWYVLKVKASARGEIGYSAFGGFTSTHIGVKLTPFVRAVARGTFSVDAIVAEAGVYGDLELIDASMPIFGSLALSSTACPGYKSDVDIEATVEGGSGEFGAFVRLLGWGTREYELFDFPNVLEHTTSLYEAPTQTFCF
jgi:hypothetical protein